MGDNERYFHGFQILTMTAGLGCDGTADGIHTSADDMACFRAMVQSTDWLQFVLQSISRTLAGFHGKWRSALMPGGGLFIGMRHLQQPGFGKRSGTEL
jgi:hypothetical protein